MATPAQVPTSFGRELRVCLRCSLMKTYDQVCWTLLFWLIALGVLFNWHEKSFLALFRFSQT